MPGQEVVSDIQVFKQKSGGSERTGYVGIWGKSSQIGE